MRYRITFRKSAHPTSSEGGQGYEETIVSDTLNVYDNSESRTPIIIVEVYDDLPKSNRLTNGKWVFKIRNTRSHEWDVHN